MQSTSTGTAPVHYPTLLWQCPPLLSFCTGAVLPFSTGSAYLISNLYYLRRHFVFQTYYSRRHFVISYRFNLSSTVRFNLYRKVGTWVELSDEKLVKREKRKFNFPPKQFGRCRSTGCKLPFAFSRRRHCCIGEKLQSTKTNLANNSSRSIRTPKCCSSFLQQSSCFIFAFPPRSFCHIWINCRRARSHINWKS